MTLSSVIFVGVMLFAFGFAVGNARKLDAGKIIVLMIVLAMIISQFAKNDSYTAVMMVGFVAGFLLPYLPDMGGIGERLSEIINQVRYRDAYEDIKRKEEEVEALREELQRERQRQNAEKTRERRERQRAEGETQREQAQQSKKGSRNEKSRDRTGRQRASSNPRVEKTEEPRKKRSDKQQSAKGTGAGQQQQRKRSQQNQNNQSSRDNQQRQSQSRTNGQNSSQATAKKPTGIRARHLETLGLDPSGEHTYAEIKKAYRRMAVKYHPDKHQTKSQQVIDEMTERFKAVQLAYQWLAANTEP